MSSVGPPERRIAWQGTMASAILAIVGTPIEIAMGRSIPGMPAWPNAASLAVSAAVLIWLIARRRKATLGQLSWAFLLVNAAIVAALWVTSSHFATAARPWTPFQANKLGVLAVAMLTPVDPVVGIVTILLFGGSALARFFTLDAVVRNHLPAGEPWAMVAFTVFAIGLFIYRLRRKSLERELFRAQAHSESIEETTKRLLAIQDLANTPLQTLEANTALVSKIPGTEPYVVRMQRALVRLHEWHRILREEAAETGWTGQHESFDALSVLSEPQSGPRNRARPNAQQSTGVRAVADASTARARARRR
jgi:hypothetical protein